MNGFDTLNDGTFGPSEAQSFFYSFSGRDNGGVVSNNRFVVWSRSTSLENLSQAVSLFCGQYWQFLFLQSFYGIFFEIIIIPSTFCGESRLQLWKDVSDVEILF